MLKCHRVDTAGIRLVSNQTGDRGRLGMIIATCRICLERIGRVLAAMLVAISTNAFAMNWEGHDGGWITDFPPAIALLEAIPEARPLPSPDCPVSPEMLANNPYEQVPLPRHRCPKKQSPLRLQADPAPTR